MRRGGSFVHEPGYVPGPAEVRVGRFIEILEREGGPYLYPYRVVCQCGQVWFEASLPAAEGSCEQHIATCPLQANEVAGGKETE
jgi:hypothetical protein